MYAASCVVSRRGSARLAIPSIGSQRRGPQTTWRFILPRSAHPKGRRWSPKRSRLDGEGMDVPGFRQRARVSTCQSY